MERSNSDFLCKVEASRERLLRRREMSKYVKRSYSGIPPSVKRRIEENNKHKQIRGVCWSRQDKKRQKAIEDTMPLSRWL